MQIRDLIAAVERIAPPSYAEAWDNVGLIVGDAAWPLTEARAASAHGGGGEDSGVGHVLLTIDLTEAVAHEALTKNAAAVIAYHPPIFSPIKRLTADAPPGRVLLPLLRAGVAVYSPHTALDAAPAGLTDWLADGLLPPAPAQGNGKEDGSAVVSRAHADRRALAPFADRPPSQQVKIVTFVPNDSVEAVRSALASAGAGIIGGYELCSFNIHGTGTFLGGEATNPTVGERGRIEEVPEVRLEMVCSKHSLALALATLRQFHPYEEPPVDVYELLPRPVRHTGAGRRLMLDHPSTLAELAERLKQHVGMPTVKIAAAPGVEIEATPITTIGLCPGAGASLAPTAAGDGCQVFVTGEMKHHEILAATGAGMSVLLCGHTASERGYLPQMARRLGELLPGVTFTPSTADVSPFVYR